LFVVKARWSSWKKIPSFEMGNQRPESSWKKTDVPDRPLVRDGPEFHFPTVERDAAACI